MRLSTPLTKNYAGDVAVEPLVHCLQSQQVCWGRGAGCITFALPPESFCIFGAQQGGPLLYHKALSHTVTEDYAHRYL